MMRPAGKLGVDLPAVVLAFSVSQLEVFVRLHGELAIAGEESVLIRLKPPKSN